MSINFVTWNDWKFREAKLILPNLEKLDIDLVEIQEFEIKEIIKSKLLEAYNITGKSCVVEDTWLYFDWLNGFPGPLIKRLFKSIWNDWISDIVIKTWNTRCYAKSCVWYIEDNWDQYYFEWVVEWNIVLPKGSSDFGWNSIFIPKWSDKTFGEMSLEEKWLFSMRAIAFGKLKDFLDK